MTLMQYRLLGAARNFGKDGDKVVILLGGGTKKGQQTDIETAIDRWQDYKQRKKSGEQ